MAIRLIRNFLSQAFILYRIILSNAFIWFIHTCVFGFFLSNHKYLCRLSLFSLKIIQKMNSSEAPRLIDCKLDSIFHSFPREISLGHMYLSTWSVNMTTPPPPPSTHIFCGIYLGYAWILSITFLSNWCNHLTLS